MDNSVGVGVDKSVDAWQEIGLHEPQHGKINK